MGTTDLMIRRAAAYMIDGIFVALMSLPLAMGCVLFVYTGFPADLQADSSLLSSQDLLKLGAAVLLGVTVGCMVWAVLVALRAGRSPGRRLTGLRVTGGSGFWWHFGREFLGRQFVPIALATVLPLVGLLAALVWLGLGWIREDRRGVHDLAWGSDVLPVEEPGVQGWQEEQ